MKLASLTHDQIRMRSKSYAALCKFGRDNLQQRTTTTPRLITLLPDRGSNVHKLVAIACILNRERGRKLMRPQLNEVAMIYVRRNTSQLDGSQVIATQRKKS